MNMKRAQHLLRIMLLLFGGLILGVGGSIQAQPSLDIEKRLILPPGGIALVGDLITFEIVLTNTGTTTITSLPLTDSFDPNCQEFLFADPGETADIPGFIYWSNRGPLLPGSRDTILIVFETVAPCETALDTASVCEAKDAFGNPVPTEDDVAGLVIVQPDVDVTKTVIDPPAGVAAVGDVITFQVIVDNSGTTDVSTVPLIDIFDPACLRYLSASPPPNQALSGLLVWCCLGPIGAGDQKTVTIQFQAEHPCGITVDTVKTFDVTDEYGFKVPGDVDVAEVNLVQPELEITKTLIDPPGGFVELSDTAVFRIVLNNTGTTEIVTLPLFDHHASDCVHSIWADPLADAAFDGELRWTNVGPLGIGDVDTVLVAFVADSVCGPASDTASVVGALDEYGFLLPDLSDGATVNIVQSKLSVTKTRIDPVFEYMAVGDTTTFEILMENTGPNIIGLLPLADTYDSLCFELVETDPPYDTHTPGHVTWFNLGPLTAGEQTSASLSLRAIDACGVSLDTAEVMGAIEGSGATLLTRQDTAYVNVVATVPEPDIDLSASSHDYGDVLVGSSVSWTFTVSNVGPGALLISSILSGHPNFIVTAPTSFPLTVGPGGFVNVTVQFTPSSEGLKSGVISILSNDPDEGIAVVSVQGNGVTPGPVALVYFPGTYYGLPGSFVTVDIYVDNLTELTEPVAGLEVRFTFDAGILTVTNVVSTPRTSGMDLFQWNEPGLGVFALIVADYGGEVISPAIGSVAQITFQIDPGASLGEIVDFHFSKAVLSDEGGFLIPSVSSDGMLIVGTYAGLRGDANIDGSIDILDVVFIRMILLEQIEPTPEQLQAADCNIDGVVDVLDILGVANVILMVNTCPPVFSTPKKAQSVGEIGFSEVSPAEGRTFALPIALRTDSDVPGMELRLGYNGDCLMLAEPQPTDRTEGMTIASRAAQGEMVILVYSAEGRAVPAGRDPVFVIPFRMHDGQGSRTEPLMWFEEVLLAEDCVHRLPVRITSGSLILKNLLPEACLLSENYPNPFNPKTDIGYQIGDGRSSVHMTLKIYNIMGQEVRTLVDGEQEPGYYTVTWDGRDRDGQPVSSGVYLYRLSVDSDRWSETKRMILMK
ncbi:MAG: choice-of-anchor D domain-containing protein [Gemmatimonadota bacterium]|nr:MAG: choice-of-anchor D domain-containing protein [Gemmatimonadota bacterium]